MFNKTKENYKPTLGILIVHGPEIRSLGYSGLIQKLSERFRIIIWTTCPNSKIFAPFSDCVEIKALPLLENSITDKNNDFVYRMHLRWYEKGGVNKWSHGLQRRGKEKGLSQRIKGWILNLISTKPIIYSLSIIDRYFEKHFKSTKWAEEFTNNNIDVLLCGNYFGPYVLDAIKTANSLGINTYVALHSWKDCYVHPRLPLKLTGIFLWSQEDQNQFKKWNPWVNYPFHITGSLHLESVRKSQIIPVKQFESISGLNLARPYICYTMASMGAVTDEDLIIDEISKKLMARFPEIQLLVRNNPMNISRDYIFSKNANVTMQIPHYEWIKELNWAPPFEDDGSLWASTIYYSLCNISLPSTVTVEFLEFHRPVINIVYDSPSHNEGESSNNRFWNAPFYKQINGNTGVYPGYTAEEIVQKTGELLNVHSKFGSNSSVYQKPSAVIASTIISGFVH